MFTPQQIEQISFGKQTFGGYDMQAVDEFLEPLTEDYITLYKENALLKNKMRVLVAKLEEYRQSEASMKDALINSQKACDTMIKEAEAKCAQMLAEANAAAIENAKNADALIAEENARVEEARRAAAARIQQLEDQLRACLQMLAEIREAHRPAPVKAAPGTTQMYDFDKESGTAEAAEPAVDPADAVADEISSNLAAMMGTTEETAPKAEPRHPAHDTTSRKFDDLKFGPNYDPTNPNNNT